MPVTDTITNGDITVIVIFNSLEIAFSVTSVDIVFFCGLDSVDIVCLTEKCHFVGIIKCCDQNGDRTSKNDKRYHICNF